MTDIKQISRDVTSGAVTSIVSLVYSLGFAAMIFTGNLSSGMPLGISALLVGTGITAIVAAALSGFRFAVSGPDGNTCSVMAAISAGISAELASKGDPHVAVINVLYLLAVTTLITGVFLSALGAVKAGRWIRFIPYPVVGGLIAAAGFLMILGALKVIADLPSTDAIADLSALPLEQLGAGLLCAVLLQLLLSRYRHPLALPLVIAGGALVFHLTMALSGSSTHEARAQGWLFAVPTSQSLWWPWSLEGIHLTQWSLLIGRASDIATLVVVTTLTLLINATGLEVVTRTDADLDRELLIQGAANVIAPVFGGFLGHLSMNRSLLNYKLGGTRRMSGFVFGGVALLLALGGKDLIAFLPRPLLGGLLLYFGMQLFGKWAIATRRQLPPADHAILLLILAVTVILGFGYGLLVGIIAGCVMFVVSYSKLRIIKHRFSGAEYRSSHERSFEDKAILTRHGAELQIFVLQGFIFFGMADRLYRSIIDMAFTSSADSARLVVIDLHAVHGIDASSIASFKKISYQIRARGAQLIISGMSPQLVAEWQASGDEDLSDIEFFADLDSGVEHCENQIIAGHSRHEESADDQIQRWLEREMGECAGRLITLMEKRTLLPGEFLCRQHQAADEVYFIERGRVSIELVNSDDSRQRLRTLGRKTVLGEMGLYRATTRSADVVAQEDCVVYSLSADSLRTIEASEPLIAARFHALVVRTLSDRLEFSSALIGALRR